MSVHEHFSPASQAYIGQKGHLWMDTAKGQLHKQIRQLQRREGNHVVHERYERPLEK